MDKDKGHNTETMSLSADHIKLLVNVPDDQLMSDLTNLVPVGQDVKVTLNSSLPWTRSISNMMKFNVFHNDSGQEHNDKPICLQDSSYNLSDDHLTFQFGFDAAKSGIYTIVAKFDNKNVTNSPMMIKVCSEQYPSLLDMSSVLDEISHDDNGNSVVTDQFKDAESDQDRIQKNEKLMKLRRAYESVKSIGVSSEEIWKKEVPKKIDNTNESRTIRRIPGIKERLDHGQDVSPNYSSSRKLSVPKPLHEMSQASGSPNISFDPPKSFTDVKGWKEVFSIPRPGLGCPIGICLLLNGKFVVSSKRESVVKMYNQDDGKFVKELTCNRSDFEQPSDMVALRNGDFAIREESKVMIFNSSGNFLRTVWESKGVLRSYGLAVDKNNKLVCMIESRVKAYLQFIDPEDPKKRIASIDLEDVIGKHKRGSLCRFLTYKDEKLYVTDLGRDKVYVVYVNGDVKEFGESGEGPGQFSDPAGLVVDNQGNMIVADSKNHRLSLFNSKLKWLKDVKLSPQVNRPSSLLFDSGNGFLYVLCLHGNKSVIKYAPII